MGLVVRVPVKKAQAMRLFLTSRGVFDSTRKPKKNGSSIIFPVTSAARKIIPNRIQTASLAKKKHSPRRLSDFLSELSIRQRSSLRKSFDVVGSIIILELDPSLNPHAIRIARYLLASHPHVKTVLQKMAGRFGTFRVQKMRFLCGVRSTKTIHTESGVRMVVDVSRVYFSPRLAGERLRIARQVKEGESVLVLFSGVAPYPLVIYRHAHPSRIVGVEINPAGHRCAKESLRINNSEHIQLIRGDAHKVAISKEFDRVIMPLPQMAGEFIDVALQGLRRGGMLHFYEFANLNTFPKESKDKLQSIVKSHGRVARIIRVVKCGQHAARELRVCIDARIS